VCTDQHLAELDEITVFLVIDFNDAPWIAAASYFAAFWVCDLVVGTDNGKGDFGKNFLILCDRFFIVEFISWALEDMNIVVRNIGKNLKD
jgi:hypothetical protein